MSNVIIDRQKIDILANAISDKSGVPVTMTLDEMVDAVDGIETSGGEPNLQAKTYTVASAGTATVTADSGYDGLSEVEVTVPQGDFGIGQYGSFVTESSARKWKCTYYATIDSGDSVGTAGFIEDHTQHTYVITYNAIPSNTAVTPTESSQTVGGYNYMMEGAVTVNAIPSNYVGSGITRRSSSDLTASGATVTVPSGYYSAQASKSVTSGTEGTPTATKGTVSNHSVSVTPSVTNTSGYISGGTKTGTAVTVSASELVSGNLAITENGTGIDVSTYSTVSVNVSGGQTTEIIIPEQTLTTTSSSTEVQVPIVNKPIVVGEEYIITVDGVSVTATAESLYGGIWLYYIQGQVAIEQYNEVYFYTSSSYVGTYTVKVEKVTGGGGATLIEKTITQNGTYDAEDDDADGYSSVTVNVPSGSSKNVQVLQSTSRTNSSSLTKVLGDLTVSKTGTYDVYWSGGRTNTSTSYTWGTRLYVDGTGYGTENTSWSNNCQSNHLSNVSLTANQKLSVYARGRTGSYYTFAPMLVIIEA